MGSSDVRKLKDYLNCVGHKEVRTKLRNQFTHALDSTSSYIFHRINDGKMQADLRNVFPRHPYENIVLVLDDVQKYLKFAKTYVGKLEKFCINNVMMVSIECSLKCGRVSEDLEPWNIGVLRKKAEKILNPCSEPCDYAIEYEGAFVCKPISVNYCRINETDRRYKGKIELHMNYAEMKRNFLEEKP